MLGHYDNFPENIHSISYFQSENSAKNLQQAILCLFQRMNHETFDLVTLNPYLKQNCIVGFEFGVADGLDFNFLDHNELDQCLKCVDETELETLDFFFAVRYHIIKDGNKRVPLRFDYFVIRFVFQESSLVLRTRHERGTQRVQLDNLIDFIVRQINAELSCRMLIPLFSGNFKKVSIQ